jgi:hypothetical protein
MLSSLRVNDGMVVMQRHVMTSGGWIMLIRVGLPPGSHLRKYIQTVSTDNSDDDDDNLNDVDGDFTLKQDDSAGLDGYEVNLGNPHATIDILLRAP